MTEEEKFFAWLDGELTAAEASEVEARVASDPKLARLAQQHRAMQERLSAAFDPIAKAAAPEPLRAATRSGAQVIALAAAKQAQRARWNSIPQWAAIAATLVVGILVGTEVPQGATAPIEVQDGKIYATATLDRALDVQLASAPAAGGKVRIGLTFRDSSGAICRSFSQPQASGLACRDANRWQVRGLFASPGGQSSEYRMAADTDPALATLIESSIAGEAFDAATERAAKERGWR
jgi:hypothetical protein